MSQTPSASASLGDPGLVVTPQTAVDSAKDGEAARVELNNAASWDDFPNGRFGDFKSPAFGNQGPWGSLGISVRSLQSFWMH